MMSLQEQLEQFRQDPTPAKAADLDSRGFLAAPGENLPEYLKRISDEEKNIRDFMEQLKREKVLEPYAGLVVDAYSVIPQEILQNAAEVTRKAYGFEIDWVPGFFPVKGLGLLWGGCAIGAYENIPQLFIIRRSFAKKKRYFIYSREELTSHELCHIARTPLNDMEYEEHFAYAISSSALRRYSGNCFKSEKDALLFLLPVFALFFIQLGHAGGYFPYLPSWPFWILIFVWPLWLLWNNRKARQKYFRAESALRDWTDHPGAVLFRCTGKEINALAEIADNPAKVRDFIEQKKESDLRWQIIMLRFMNKEEHHG